MSHDDLVTPGGLLLDPSAVRWATTRSGGPGGQHANTSDTAVVVTVDLAAAGLSGALTDRLIAALGETVTARASDTRSQWRNRQLAWHRLASRLDRAARPTAPRRPTRPTRAALAQRLDLKHRRSVVKRNRRPPDRHDD